MSTTRSLALASVLVLAGATAHAAVSPATRCLAAKLGAAARHARDQLGCRATAARAGQPVSATCLSRADTRLARAFARAERRGGCLTTGDAGDVALHGAALARRAAGIIVPDGGTPTNCGSRQLRAGRRLVTREVRAHARNAKRPDVPRLVTSFALVHSRFAKDMAKAATAGDCQTSDVAVAQGLFEAGLDAIYAAVGLVGFQTTSIASAAEGAHTPGTSGVDANDYPKLVTQFGGTGFSLNRATYTRFSYHGTATPDVILILVPGFEGGAMSFKILAENLVTRAQEEGLRAEVWAFDRRGNQLEDRAGITVAVGLRDGEVALDWMFGGELGLPLSPALAGLGRRAIFHNTRADTAFMADWTNLVFSRDIDAVVDAAHAVTDDVYLGGHSAGTGFTARYASTDFDLTGGGPADPGYAKLRGLVLLEGGGGSTGGTPLTADALDRIEDKADGGLFHAVHDSAPRCVDGTPCTVATEAADCAGKGNGTCTPTADAYSIVPGLLNARVLASAEPGAVQGLDDPNTGQVNIQVDHGIAGNNAIAKVPDLSALAILPAATAAGALGTFIDDDGFVSAFATFIRTSVGGPGPVVGGVLTWNDITILPIAPALLPDNGPAPTALPGGIWGPEKEVTRIDRMSTTFITPNSNFTDWYYPNAGPSTTSGINLDSTQLSVGRGRRDIENLTEAPDIDIPVIAFGGTNGLAPIPAAYVPFAQSIGTCTAPSCDGTPRVVDASLPNPAFPTFGDVPGGFEVHMNGGYAHIDIVTAEDDADNDVIEPLIQFLGRNRQ